MCTEQRGVWNPCLPCRLLNSLLLFQSCGGLDSPHFASYLLPTHLYQWWWLFNICVQVCRQLRGAKMCTGMRIASDSDLSCVVAWEVKKTHNILLWGLTVRSPFCSWSESLSSHCCRLVTFRPVIWQLAWPLWVEYGPFIGRIYDIYDIKHW